MVDKAWAFRSEDGPDRVSAAAVSRERAKFGGRPTGDIYFSTHKPPNRKRMKHVQKGKTSFFSYINGDVDGGDGGESLTHRLFKEAVSGVRKTKLCLGKSGDHDVVITHGEIEKPIQVADGTYYADAYWQFTSTSKLGIKWSGHVYIEVHKSHLVPTEKIEQLRQLGLPVVEVGVPALFEYPYSDDQTTDEREVAHIEKVRRILEGGFLAGTVISNPSSQEFMGWEMENTLIKAKEALAYVQKELSAEQGRGQEAERKLLNAENREVSLSNQIGQIKEEYANRLHSLKGTIGENEGSLIEKDREIERLENWLLLAGCVITVAIGLALWLVFLLRHRGCI